MLSPSTLEFLRSLCETSHAAYPEGGILWTYIEAANQAHSKLESVRRLSGVEPLRIEDFGRWLQVPLGDWGRADLPPNESAKQLVALLRVDLEPDQMSVLVDDQSGSASFRICMARAADNHYFELELWWSLD